MNENKKDKSILQEAAFELKMLEETMKTNTTNILKDLVKEAFDKKINTDEDEEKENDEIKDTNAEDVDNSETAETPEISDEVPSEEMQDLDDETIVPDENTEGVEEVGEELDMRDAAFDDIVAKIESLQNDDEVVIVTSKDDVKVQDQDGETKITLGGEESTENNVVPLEDEGESISDDETGDEDEEAIFSIEIPDEEETEVKEDEGEEKIEENITQTLRNEKKFANNMTADDTNKIPSEMIGESFRVKMLEYKDKYEKLLGESKAIKAEIKEAKDILTSFKTKLTEAVNLNNQLGFITKLFLENTTSKDEKKQIAERFTKEGTTLEESKRLYKEISTELKKKQSASKVNLNESKTKETTLYRSKELDSFIQSMNSMINYQYAK